MPVPITFRFTLPELQQLMRDYVYRSGRPLMDSEESNAEHAMLIGFSHWLFKKPRVLPVPPGPTPEELNRRWGKVQESFALSPSVFHREGIEYGLRMTCRECGLYSEFIAEYEESSSIRDVTGRVIVCFKQKDADVEILPACEAFAAVHAMECHIAKQPTQPRC